MSPTFKEEDGYKFYIYSNEEAKIHVHVSKDENEAKVWLCPVELARNNGFSKKELNRIIKIVREYEEEFATKFRAHVR
jgi:RNAse (barnase) inhibitor barstar